MSLENIVGQHDGSIYNPSLSDIQGYKQIQPQFGDILLFYIYFQSDISNLYISVPLTNLTQFRVSYTPLVIGPRKVIYFKFTPKGQATPAVYINCARTEYGVSVLSTGRYILGPSKVGCNLYSM